MEKDYTREWSDLLKSRKKLWSMCAISAVSQSVAYLFSVRHESIFSGLVLMLTAVLFYGLELLRSGNPITARGLFLLSWIGGEGIACLKLSRLQAEQWHVLTWLCFTLAPICFLIGYEVFSVWVQRNCVRRDWCNSEVSLLQKRVLVCIGVLEIASLCCFTLEAVRLGFIPLWSDLPHAYSTFHLTGVHYITISCVLIPALTVVHRSLGQKNGLTGIEKLVLGVGNLVAFGIPVLCVSRFQLLFAVGFGVITYGIVYQKKVSGKILFGLVTGVLVVYVLLTVARNHDVAYLNSIFEMKSKKMPIFLTQPYIYIANNYENFNCMVEQLTSYARGLRQLYPFLALSGLKFVVPRWTVFEVYRTKEELTTLTLFYDSYYDFGVAGVSLLALLTGGVTAFLEEIARNKGNPVACLFYGQMTLYLTLSFFTTWFSFPTTWFWFGVTTVMYLYIEKGGKSLRKGENGWKRRKEKQ